MSEPPGASLSRVVTLSGDLSRPAAIAAIVLAVASVVLLVVELRRRRRGGVAAFATGVVATAALALAVLRPVSIVSRGSRVGPRVVVLADRSRSVELPAAPGGGETRLAAEARALRALQASAADARLDVLGFGDGDPSPWDPAAPGAAATAPTSDLSAALAAVAASPAERPAAIVVMSDGRLDRPGETGTAEATKAALGSLAVPVHTVALATRAPRDASVRSVKAAGAAVAHQPMPLRIEIGCEGLACDAVPVTARELLEGGSPGVLGHGVAHVENGVATVEMTVTLERAGASIVEVAIDAPEGDEIPDDDRRLVSFDVARDRIRVLHVAGEPTYDTRALRMWIKSDASVDLVAFFILRTPRSNVRANEKTELSLIPFPVDELFSVHLPSFDAVVLQDFDARPQPVGYGLEPHLPALAEYVRRGGGLIMVGGPQAFGAGGYAGSPLAGVLPVELPPETRSESADPAPFVPAQTDLARVAPMLRASRALLGDALPEMPGTNLVGDARPGSFVLWEHPRLRTRTGAPMPVLTLGESGDGRAIALTVDGTWRLAYSPLASESSGRAHGALWDGLLGWLMRDPRYEPAQIEPGRCIAGQPMSLSIRPLPGSSGVVRAEVVRLGEPGTPVERTAPLPPGGGPLSLDLGPLAAGGWSARVRIGDGPSTRRDFPCERGGDEWADSRPDPARLRAIAAATGGKYVDADGAGSLPLPASAEIASERHVAPLLPAWVWTLAAALALGAHWIVRRRSGLA